jgi:hypothetical protein
VPLFRFDMRQEALGLGVMVGDLYPGHLVGVQNGSVQLGDRAVLPQRPGTAYG